ncbi:hypothetical protein F5Y18DRAFT_378844 [Xylariaceae sp. FL1019]|nr:hypothetical protein F5Y18DRAFT_378844 [Xylariaceae sp. FL1019]
MAHQVWSEAPELAGASNYPEVYYPVEPQGTHQNVGYQQHQQRHETIPSSGIPLRMFESTPITETPKSSYPMSTSNYTFDGRSMDHVLATYESPREPSRRICGVPFLVFVLSTAIAALLVATVGLAAGTGVQSNRANDAEAKLAQFMANSSTKAIDGGCSADPGAVSGTTYTSDYNNKPTFKIYCNNDAPNSPLISLFVGNIQDCMDACGFYSSYIPDNFPKAPSNSNATCAGISFIPNWTNRTYAQEQAGNAPGNCYLKPGPQNTTALTPPSGNDAVHAAIIPTS